jgi:protein-S-isoprenylcysteine O-methyltransferase Ste14
MTIPLIATVMRGFWLIAEWIHALNHQAESTERDKFSRTIWDVGTCIGVVGVIVGYTDVGHIETERGFLALGGIVVMFVGLAIRWTAIYTLGKYFTRTVTIKHDHLIIQRGLYKYLRHPSYTGALIALAGLGLAFTNWLSFVLIFAPILVAALYRMHVEEDALEEAFGGEYVEYAKHTKRLIPKIY